MTKELMNVSYFQTNGTVINVLFHFAAHDFAKQKNEPVFAVGADMLPQRKRLCPKT